MSYNSGSNCAHNFKLDECKFEITRRLGPITITCYTLIANMADHSVGPWDESHESEASQALMFCFDSAFPEKSCLVVGCFTIPTHFCVPECRRKGEIFHSRESVLVFSFLLRL